MRRKEFMNVNEERLKEIMAHETDADGCPKTHPDGIEKEEDRGKEGVCIHTRWQDRKADRFPQARCPVRDLPCGKDEDISCRLSQPQGVRPPQADLYQL